MATQVLENLDKKSAYDAVFQEGIIEKVSLCELESGCHFLHYRPMFKASNHSTIGQPVFYDSCNTSGWPSLNDCLEKGLNLIELFRSILLRFRVKKIGDIHKCCS